VTDNNPLEKDEVWMLNLHSYLSTMFIENFVAVKEQWLEQVQK
jgi:hypothetical protein